MFNNYDVTNTLKINACSGGIYKTYRESWFESFHLDSHLARSLFRKEKCYYFADERCYKDYNFGSKGKEVTVLQMIICGEEKVIAEIITKEDFDKYFKKGNSANE